MPNALNLQTQTGVGQPSEYSKALKLKRKVDVAIRQKELQQMTHNIQAVVEGRESTKDYIKSVGRSAFAGGIGGAALGGIAAVPLTLAKTPFRSLRNKPIGMATVGAGTVLSALGFGSKRFKEGKRSILPQRTNPQLSNLRQIREDLKNPETPTYNSYVRRERKIKI